MKNFIGNAIASALISRGVIKGGYPISLSRPSYANRTMLRSRRGGTALRNRRRRRRRNAGAGLEINKASGGFKSIINTGAVRHLAINEYGRLVLSKAGASYSYKITLKKESHATEYTTVDLAALINESEEFNEWCQCSNQYKIYGIRITIDYSRVPESGDTLARLLMSVRTDKADVQDPKIERNVMNLDMSTTGVKNFNFNLNNRNTNVEHLGWTDTQDYYSAVVLLKLEGQDITLLKDTEPSTVVLGTIKFSFMAKCRLRDYIPGNGSKRPVLRRKKITLYEVASDTHKDEVLTLSKLESQFGKIRIGVEKEEKKKEEKEEIKEDEEESEYDDEEEQIKAFSSTDERH
jgi:hypothetical protein